MKAFLLALLLALAAAPAAAHKASDAYLRLDLDDGVTGTIDVALRDLELAIGLDGDGDGAITWGEVKAGHDAFAGYLADRLRIDRGGPCGLRVTEQLIDHHSDGAYAVARFVADCPGDGPVTLRYDLLFDLDPSHRGLLSAVVGGGVVSAVLGPDSPPTVLDGAAPPPSGLVAFFVLGLEHIAFGFDHLLFLLVILLPLAFRRSEGGPPAGVEVLKILSAFTLAHGLSMTLALLGLVDLPARLVESAIAATILLAAVDNLHPFLPGRRWQIAFAFGLIHGLGFAAALGPVELPPLRFAEALLGFNLGIEAGQVIAAALFFTVALILRRLVPRERAFLAAGSGAALAMASVWLVDRALALGVAPF